MEINPTALLSCIRGDIQRASDSKGFPLIDSTCALSSLDRFTDPRTIACAALERSILKKYEPLKRNRDLGEKAVALFRTSNELCSRWQVPTNASLIDQMRFIASRELPALDWQTVLGDAMPGPGASVGSQGQNSAFEKFFINTFTTTDSALYTEYRTFVSKQPTWWSAELRRLYLQGGNACQVVHGSNLSTVAKNSDIDRVICTEPSLNMLFQKALGTQIDRVLSKFYGYSKALQPVRNQRAARLGSGHGRQCTIDLTSASDTISLDLVKYILPSDWFAAVMDCRSPQTKINGSYEELYMVSSMGNGFTFQLMTYIFSLLLKALCQLKHRKFRSYSHMLYEFGVFGDDIIVPSDLYEDTIHGLQELGFIPNTDKSYGSGPFRESCGSDWFNLKNVRGVYCKRLHTIQDRYSLVNRLNRWSAKWKIPLVDTVQLLMPAGWKQALVPTDESDTAGLKVPQFLRGTSSPIYYAYLPRGKYRSIYRKVVMSDETVYVLKQAFDNPLGVLLCSSVGLLHSDRLSRRRERTIYQRVRKFCPFWARAIDLSRHGVSFADWETYTYINLTGMM